MANFNRTREIDSEKLGEIILDSGKTLSELSQMIGANTSYLSGVLHSGRITTKYIKRLCEVLHVSESSFVIKKIAEELFMDAGGE